MDILTDSKGHFTKVTHIGNIPSNISDLCAFTHCGSAIPFLYLGTSEKKGEPFFKGFILMPKDTQAFLMPDLGNFTAKKLQSQALNYLKHELHHGNITLIEYDILKKFFTPNERTSFFLTRQKRSIKYIEERLKRKEQSLNPHMQIGSKRSLLPLDGEKLNKQDCFFLKRFTDYLRYCGYGCIEYLNTFETLTFPTTEKTYYGKSWMTLYDGQLIDAHKPVNLRKIPSPFPSRQEEKELINHYKQAIALYFLDPKQEVHLPERFKSPFFKRIFPNGPSELQQTAQKLRQEQEATRSVIQDSIKGLYRS